MVATEGLLTEILDSGLFSDNTGTDGYNYETKEILPKQNGISLLYYIGLCVSTKDHSLLIWFLASVSVSMLFVLPTFIVYSVLPELKNLHGSIFRCYLASYISCMILFTIFLVCDMDPQETLSFVVVFTSTVGFTYFGTALMLWLNVMSFDIWRTFRQLRPSSEINNSAVKKRQKKKFILYSCYAWGVPLGVILSVFAAVLLLKDFESNILQIFWIYIPVLPIVGIAICNTCLYISTALTIKQRKKETAHLISSTNKHHQENEEWFNLYVKLFVVMGCPLIFWAVGIYLRNEIFWKIVYLLEAMQGISIFFIFVWKDNVRKSSRERFGNSLRTLRSFFQCVSNPESEIQEPSLTISNNYKNLR